MKRGLVIGKFLPVHHGHVALIRFAAAQCDEVIVSMSYTPEDAIDPALRFSWIQEIFKDELAIKPAMVRDDFDNEALPWPERTRLWSEFIRKTYPPIDLLFSSEEYGEPFAQHLGAQHRSFDPPRGQHPVSGTGIRENPFRYWEFIPAVVRPYFVKKICLYGPESTGKSTLTAALAAYYQTTFVPEVAREMITSNDFTVHDIVRIGVAHYERIVEKTQSANKILFCDTDAITTQIYARLYLNVVPGELLALERKVHYHHYFFLDIDVPWIADGLRDLGHRREEMRDWFRRELDARGIAYTMVRGDFEQREAVIRHAIDALLAR